ncbi:MAG TPA: FeoA family protein, partial [Tepidisphaeraceae bacterium]|nr:FeoA family protein [Tepidisphaeraceae bacterium]
HGDPIPTRGGTVARPRHVSLADAEPGARYRVARVADQDVAFLQFVDRCRLTPGTTVTVESIDPAADAVHVKPRAGERVTLGTAAAAKIFVERVA